MLKTVSKCRVCQAIKTNTVLLNKIYNSGYYIKGGQTLKSIATEYQDKFSYQAIKIHVKKHQFISKEQFVDKTLKNIAKAAEQKIQLKAIDSMQVYDEVINKGMEALEEGKTMIDAKTLVQAAKAKADYEFKRKDQEIAMLDMVMHFASGENTESLKYDRRFVESKAVTDYDPTEEPTGYIDEGTDGPRGVHYPPTWDATTPGADEVPGSSEDGQIPQIHTNTEQPLG